MITEFNSSVMDIDRREVVELADSASGSVTCMSGSIWISESGSSDDIVLEAGQSLSLKNKRGVVIQGLRVSTLRLTRVIARTHRDHELAPAIEQASEEVPAPVAVGGLRPPQRSNCGIRLLIVPLHGSR